MLGVAVGGALTLGSPKGEALKRLKQAGFGTGASLPNFSVEEVTGASYLVVWGTIPRYSLDNQLQMSMLRVSVGAALTLGSPRGKALKRVRGVRFGTGASLPNFSVEEVTRASYLVVWGTIPPYSLDNQLQMSYRGLVTCIRC